MENWAAPSKVMPKALGEVKVGSMLTMEVVEKRRGGCRTVRLNGQHSAFTRMEAELHQTTRHSPSSSRRVYRATADQLPTR